MNIGRWLAWVGVLFSLSRVAEAQTPAAGPMPAAEASPAAGATSAAGPAPEPSVSCFPECRSGHLCKAGTCVSRCNPPCATGETCRPDGECQRLASPTSATVWAESPSSPSEPEDPSEPEGQAAAADRPTRVVFGLHVGIKPAGGGDLKTTCSPQGSPDCGDGTASTSFDDTSPATLGTEVLIHVTQALRLGAGYWLVPYVSTKNSGSTESFHRGSEHRLVGVVEGIIPVSGAVSVALRFQGGATMLLVGGDLADSNQAIVATCPVTLCQPDDGPFFGGNYALMGGILVGEKLRFRGDLALDRFSYQTGSANFTINGSTIHGETQLNGTRFWVMAGLELF